MKCLCYTHTVNFLNCYEKTSLHLSFSLSLNSSNCIHFILLKLYNLFNYSSPSHSFFWCAFKFNLSFHLLGCRLCFLNLLFYHSFYHSYLFFRLNSQIFCVLLTAFLTASHSALVCENRKNKTRGFLISAGSRREVWILAAAHSLQSRGFCERAWSATNSVAINRGGGGGEVVSNSSSPGVRGPSHLAHNVLLELAAVPDFLSTVSIIKTRQYTDSCQIKNGGET